MTLVFILNDLFSLFKTSRNFGLIKEIFWWTLNLLYFLKNSNIVTGNVDLSCSQNWVIFLTRYFIINICESSIQLVNFGNAQQNKITENFIISGLIKLKYCVSYLKFRVFEIYRKFCMFDTIFSMKLIFL